MLGICRIVKESEQQESNLRDPLVAFAYTVLSFQLLHTRLMGTDGFEPPTFLSFSGQRSRDLCTDNGLIPQIQ